MFLRRAQADDTNSVVIAAFGEDHHIQAGIDLPQGDEADFSIIELVIFTLERRLLSALRKPLARPRRTAR